MATGVNFVSALVDRLRSEAKRLAEDTNKILQTIEFLEEMLQSGHSDLISKAQTDDALYHLNKADLGADSGAIIQVATNLMKDAAQLSMCKEVMNSSLSDTENNVRKNLVNSMSPTNADQQCPNKANGAPIDNSSDFIYTVKAVLHFPTTNCIRIVPQLELFVPKDKSMELDEEDESGELNGKRKLVETVSELPSKRFKVESCDSRPDNESSLDSKFQWSSATAGFRNKLFQYVANALQSLIFDAKKRDCFNFDILDLGASGEEVKIFKVSKFQRKHATGTAAVQLYGVHVDRGMPWSKATERNLGLVGEEEGFYISHQVRNSNNTVVLAVALESNSSNETRPNQEDMLYTLYWPNKGHDLHEMTLREIKSKYKKVPKDEAELHWTKHYESSKTICSHAYWGGRCKNVASGKKCDVGVQRVVHTIFAGYAPGVWTEADGLLNSTNIHGKRMQIVRLHSFNQEPDIIIGKLIPDSSVKSLTQALQEDAHKMEEEKFLD
ncbi:protein strawberry notch-like [Thrips palmi]|uniref:Protein strawberry notch-like n=1 Tax=Thrips palmi TaxID=161013 RepID=A0A6P8YM46_THRPL|nr:protein strawberry notch-like [Thrips palmi]XP_034241007.1 protein strawberry notch-like [Thrips palmi]XP_034241008.1 protein strawberry notch-like [Thrips palmi]XP_034241009.1 protein strawberry notch-like [Thrips palmi]